jgi:hypothetical protein
MAASKQWTYDILYDWLFKGFFKAFLQEQFAKMMQFSEHLPKLGSDRHDN